MTPLLRNTLRSESGQSMIEFAICLSVLMAFVFSLIELCLMFYTNGMLSECARQGTRYAIVRGSTCQTSTGTSCAATAANVNSYVSHLGIPNIGGGTMTVATTFPDGNQAPGSRVLVSTSYSFPVTLPFVPHQSFSLSEMSEMYIVQ